MKKKFIVFYVHSDYGRYTTKLEDFKNINEALDYFRNHYVNGHTVYGIIEIN